MISVQRALPGGQEAVDAVPTTDFSSPSFQPRTSDVWVNALWFTSLALSLATSLIAVLTKQWIHHYASLPSAGTPLIRSRVRHFRFTGLQKWHVPLIIDLLPVLMHASLGLFFLGLVVYLYSLNWAIAVDLGLIGSLCFLAYLVTTLLPSFYTDCSYRTPLSSYLFFFIGSLESLRRDVLSTMRIYFARARNVFLHRVLRHAASTPPSYFNPAWMPPLPPVASSLGELELCEVNRLANVIDVSNLASLFNTTSNLSVQSVILQSLSSLPLQCVSMFKKPAPHGISSVLDAITEHSYWNQPLDRFERFRRTALRFKDFDCSTTGRHPVFFQHNTASNYTRYESPVAAIELIRNTMTTSGPETRWDVVLWGTIFSNALINGGLKWLEMDANEPSPVWSELLRYACLCHDCDQYNCGGQPPAPLYVFPEYPGLPPLSITKYNMSTSYNLGSALLLNMRPSFVNWVLRVAYSNASDENHASTIPADIFLLLNMVKTPSIQKTSSLHQVWKREGREVGHGGSVFRQLIEELEGYALGTSLPTIHRGGVVQKSIICALKAVMKMDTFGSSDAMLLEDEGMIVKIVFNGLNIEMQESESEVHDLAWLTPDVGRKVLRVAFAADSLEDSPFEILSHVMSYLLCSSTTLDTMESLYTTLVDRYWLQGLSVWIDAECDPFVSLPMPYHEMPYDPLHTWHNRHTAFLAACYIDGLPSLAAHSPDTYARVLSDLSDPVNLSTMCKILLTADTGTQEKLWKLAQIVRVDHWPRCLEELVFFAVSQKGWEMYDDTQHCLPLGLAGKQTENVPGEAVPIVAAAFANDVMHGVFTPPSYSPSHLAVSRCFVYFQTRGH